MNQNEPIFRLSRKKIIDHKRRAAFHEAGHAAGLYLNTKSRRLPPVSFKIIFKEMGCCSAVTDDILPQTIHDDCIAQVEGGRLIEFLPQSVDNLVRELTEHNKAVAQLVDDYMAAFEVDIINLLIGPLAEAKYIADTDDELFNHQLVNLKALKNYGGISNLALVNEYLQSFFADIRQDEKLAELFAEAFDFINNDMHWAAITKLAEHILDSSCKSVIYSDEIISLLDQSITNFRERRAVARQRHNAWFKVADNPIKISYDKSLQIEKCPSQAELDSMSHAEKDALIVKLFELFKTRETHRSR